MMIMIMIMMTKKRQKKSNNNIYQWLNKQLATRCEHFFFSEIPDWVLPVVKRVIREDMDRRCVRAWRCRVAMLHEIKILPEALATVAALKTSLRRRDFIGQLFVLHMHLDMGFQMTHLAESLFWKKGKRKGKREIGWGKHIFVVVVCCCLLLLFVVDEGLMWSCWEHFFLTLKQKWHWYGFSPVCTVWWVLTWLFWVNPWKNTKKKVGWEYDIGIWDQVAWTNQVQEICWCRILIVWGKQTLPQISQQNGLWRAFQVEFVSNQKNNQ